MTTVETEEIQTIEISEPTPSALVVLGMHRSGTSLATSLLQSAGLRIGERLMEGNSSNPKGHFENLDFYEFHQRVLQSQNISPEGWTLQKEIEVEDLYIDEAHRLIETNRSEPVWGWKDPRTVLFLEFWAALLPQAKFVIVYRSPWEVVDSLYRRGDELFRQQPNLALKFWLHYNRKILSFHQAQPERCLLANIDVLVCDTSAWVAAINQQFQVSLAAAAALYEPSLLHVQADCWYRASLVDFYFPEAIELYEALEAAAWRPEGVQINVEWKQQIKLPPHRSWVFQDWVSRCHVELQNQHLATELQQVKGQLQSMQQPTEQLIEPPVKRLIDSPPIDPLL